MWPCVRDAGEGEIVLITETTFSFPYFLNYLRSRQGPRKRYLRDTLLKRMEPEAAEVMNRPEQLGLSL